MVSRRSHTSIKLLPAGGTKQSNPIAPLHVLQSCALHELRVCVRPIRNRGFASWLLQDGFQAAESQAEGVKTGRRPVIIARSGATTGCETAPGSWGRSTRMFVNSSSSSEISCCFQGALQNFTYRRVPPYSVPVCSLGLINDENYQQILLFNAEEG